MTDTGPSVAPFSGANVIATSGDDLAVSRRVVNLIKAFPELGSDAATLYGVASSPGNDDQMMQQASQALATVDMQQTIDGLRSQDPVVQRSDWAQMPAARQQLLQSKGYQPPAEHTDNGGWTLGILGHDITTIGEKGAKGPLGAVGSAISDVTDAAAVPLGTGFNAMAAAGDFPAHINRMRVLLNDQSAANKSTLDIPIVSDLLQPWRGLNVLDPASIASAWSDTLAGEHSFRKQYVDEANNMVGADPVKLAVAKSIAAGDQAADYAKSLGLDPDKNHDAYVEAAKTWNHIGAQDDVRAAAEHLTDGHVTMGRSVISNLGVNDFHPAWAKAATGALDAYLVFKLDPLILATKYAKAAEFAKYGYKGPGDIDRMINAASHFEQFGDSGSGIIARSDLPAAKALSRTATRWAEGWRLGLVKTGEENPLTNSRFQDLLRNDGQFQTLFKPFTDWYAAQVDKEITPQRVLDFLRENAGKESILKTGPMRDTEQFLMPHTTKLQASILENKIKLDRGVDWLADTATKVKRARIDDVDRALVAGLTPGTADAAKAITTADHVSDLFLDNLVAPVGRFMQALSSYGMINGRHLDLASDEAVGEILKFVDYSQITGYTRADREQWIAKMLGQGSESGDLLRNTTAFRRQVGYDFMQSMFDHAGIGNSQFAEQFAKRTAQAYHLDPDRTAGELIDKAAIYPHQMATEIATPSVQELIQATRQTGVAKVLGAYTASPIDDRFTRVWKPLTLMHLGFMPRVAGEEMLRKMLTMDRPLNFVRSQFARLASDYTLRDLDEAMTTLPRDANGVLLDDAWVRKAPPGSTLAFPLKLTTRKLDSWANAAVDAGLREPSQFGHITSMLDGYTNRLASAWEGALGGAADKVGIMDKRELLQKFVGPERLDNYYRAMSSQYFKQAIASHASSTMFEDMNELAKRGTTPMKVGEGKNARIVQVRLMKDGSAQEYITAQDADFGQGVVHKVDNLSHDVVARPAVVDAAHWIPDEQSQRIADNLTWVRHTNNDYGAAGLITPSNPLDFVREVHNDVGGLDPRRRERIADWLNGHLSRDYIDKDLAELQTRANKGEAWAIDESDRMAGLLDYADTMPNKQAKQDIYMLLNREINPDLMSANKADFQRRLERIYRDTMLEPGNHAEVRQLSNAAFDQNAELVGGAPLAEGQVPMWTVMSDKDATVRFEQLLHSDRAYGVTDREAGVSFQANLTRDLRALGLDDATVEHVVDSVITKPTTLYPKASDQRRALQTLRDTNEAKGETMSPLLAWASPRDDIADVVRKNIDQYMTRATGELPPNVHIGRIPASEQLLKRYWGIETPEGVGWDKANSLRMDTAHMTWARPYMQDRNLALNTVRVNDFYTSSASDEMVRALRRDGHTVDVLDRAPAESTLGQLDQMQKLAKAQAEDTLSLLHNGPEAPHALLQPALEKARVRTSVNDAGEAVREFQPNALTVDHWHDIDPAMWPEKVYGARTIPVQLTRWERVVNGYFDNVVGPAISSLTRHPMYVESYGKHARMAEKVLDEFYRSPQTEMFKSRLLSKGPDGFGVSEHDLRNLYRDPQVQWDFINKSAHHRIDPVTGDVTRWGLDDEERKAFDKWTSANMAREHAIDETATTAAMREITPYIHDPAVRAQMQAYVGSLVPFWFAQQQFLVRWGKTFLQNPGAARKLQILHDGMRNTGMVQKDPNTGEDVIIWPGSSIASEILAKANPLWPGGGSFRSVAFSPMSGNVSMVLPGFSEDGPSLGPVSALALHGITTLHPEFAHVEQALMSDKQDPNKGIWDYIMPSGLMKLYEAGAGDVDKGTLASMNRNAIMYLTAHGEGPPVDATPAEKDAWLDKVRNLTRSQLLLRGLFGLAGPPGGAYPDYFDALNDDYKKMLADGITPDDAFALLVERHKGEVGPNTMFPAYTVFGTQSAGGGNVPTSDAALQFMEDHPELVKDFPAGASFLLPQGHDGSSRGQEAYNQQLATGMRSYRTPQQMLDQILFASGAGPYFERSDQHKAILAATESGSPARQTEEREWKVFSDSWKATHPTFASMLEEPTGSHRRQQVRDDLNQIFHTGEQIDTPQAATIQKLLDGWDEYQARLDSFKLTGRTTQIMRKEQAEHQQFAAWAEAVVRANPSVASFYNSVLRPDMPDQYQTFEA